MTILILVTVLFFVFGLVTLLFHPRWLAHFAPVTTPNTFGFIRIIVTSVAIIYVLQTSFVTTVLLFTALDTDFYTPVGILTPLLQTDWFIELLSNPYFLLGLKLVTLLFLSAALIGYRLRFTLIASTILYSLYTGILLQSLLTSHYGIQVILCLALLAIAPTNQSFTFKPHYKTVSPNEIAATTISTYALLIILTIPYIFAVTNKLLYMGGNWFSVENIRGYLHVGSYLNFNSWQWGLMMKSVSVPDWILVAGGVGVVVLQIVYIFILVSHRARQILPLLIILLHTAIYILMGFLFIDLVILQGIVYIVSLCTAQGEITEVEIRQAHQYRSGYKIMVFVIVLMTAISTIFAVKLHPFSNWAVYATGSTYYSRQHFTYNSLQFVHNNNEWTELSIKDFTSSANLYSYPRQSCYFEKDVRRLQDSCNEFFNRTVSHLNNTVFNKNPVTAVFLLERRWEFEDLQSSEISLFDTPPQIISTFTINTSSD